jgi:hypothetical protein
MIIGIGGRLGSGKSTLSHELIKLNYKKISFADYLKLLLSKTFNFDVNLLYSQDSKSEKLSSPFIWNESVAIKLFDNAQINDYNLPIYNKSIYSRRELMQFIGTDILRSYDSNFHVKKTIESMTPEVNYVCDDFRYLNELTALKKMGAISYYLIRPSNFEISNHDSEVSLNWTYFDRVIINDKPKDKLIKNFINSVNYIDNKTYSYKNHLSLNKDTLAVQLENFNYNIDAVAKYFNCSKSKIIWWSKNFLIYLMKNTCIYDKSCFLNADKYSAYYAGVLSSCNCIKKCGKYGLSYSIDLLSNNLNIINGFKKYLKSNTTILLRKRKNGKTTNLISIKSPYILENLKYWNLKSRKKLLSEIPDIIKNNNKLLRFWLLGLIDGQECSLVGKKKSISILSDKNTILSLKELYNVGSILNLDYLYEWRINGEDINKLYNLIYDPLEIIINDS